MRRRRRKAHRSDRGRRAAPSATSAPSALGATRRLRAAQAVRLGRAGPHGLLDQSERRGASSPPPCSSCWPSRPGQHAGGDPVLSQAQAAPPRVDRRGSRRSHRRYDLPVHRGRAARHAVLYAAAVDKMKKKPAALTSISHTQQKW